MVTSDLEAIGKHMAERPNIYRCAECLSAELPSVGKDRVDAAFSRLGQAGYRDPVLWYETNECDQCGMRGPAVIVH